MVVMRPIGDRSKRGATAMTAASESAISERILRRISGAVIVFSFPEATTIA